MKMVKSLLLVLAPGGGDGGVCRTGHGHGHIDGGTELLEGWGGLTITETSG